MVAVVAFTVSGRFQGATGVVVWKPCGGDPDSFFEWRTMEMNPDPAILGGGFKVAISGNTGKIGPCDACSADARTLVLCITNKAIHHEYEVLLLHILSSSRRGILEARDNEFVSASRLIQISAVM
jgi:hypothetical protein